MAFCDFGISEISLGCLNNSGGLITIALAPFESVTGYTSTTDALGAIDYISDILASGGTGNTPFYKWEFAKNGASFIEDKTGTIEAGSINYTTTLTLRIPRREKAKRNSLAIAGASYRNLLVLVKDGNSEWNLMGLTRGANLTASSSTSGALPDDGTSYDITITAAEPNQMPFVLGSAALAAIATA
jgi:hypothetical protein